MSSTRALTVSAPGLGILRDIARRVMRERHLAPEFSPAALREAAAIDRAAAPAAAGIRDLRGRPWASIDNDDSRDLDQLSVAEPLSGGDVKILIAVADVDALAGRGSAIDEHARVNTTSVYTVAQVFPMLPERLSTDLTSLAEGEERIAIIVEMVVSGDGSVTASDVYRAVVINHAKLAYNGVAEWLEGAAPPPARLAAVPGLEEQLRVQDRVAQQLRQVRHAHGALSLASSEALPVLEGEVLRDLRPEERNRAKELIEDFMIAANGVTARFLASRGVPSLRRILRTPERWGRIAALAAEHGDQLPPAPSARDLNQFLLRRRRADPTGFADLCLAVIKLLGRGEYVLEVPGEPVEGHFALAVSDYTHATAPNRRFPDLMTQRLLKRALAGEPPPYGEAELRALAAHCTAQEDNAAKVERQLRKSAAALLLRARIGERFEGIVTGAGPQGTWVRISSPTAEGKVIRGFDGLEVGQHVRVTLVETDVDRGFIDFEVTRSPRVP